MLSTTGFTPKGIVIPTSAAILHDEAGYDTALEDFSKRVMPFIEHTIDPSDGASSIHNDTAWLYRYPDLTYQIENLGRWFELAVRTELVEELEVLRAVDAAKANMREILELVRRAPGAA